MMVDEEWMFVAVERMIEKEMWIRVNSRAAVYTELCTGIVEYWCVDDGDAHKIHLLTTVTPRMNSNPKLKCF